MKNVYTKTKKSFILFTGSTICKFLILSLLQIIINAEALSQRTATVSGNWSSTTTWGGLSVPNSSDDVTINAGVTVTVDAAANAKSLTINGTLNINSGNNNLTIANSGFVTINNGGSIVFNSTAVINGGGNGNNGIDLTINSGANVTTANVAGFIVPGSNSSGTNGFTMNNGNKTWTYSAGANYTFNGSAAQATGTAITGINNLTVNNSSGLTLSTSAIVSGILTLTAGTLTIGANTMTFSGSSITRNTGNIDAGNASATLVFTNIGSLSLPASVFTGTVQNFKVNTAGGVTLGSATTINTLTIGDVTSNSIFNDGGNQITSTGTFNLTSGAFKLGAVSATSFPAFGTINIAAGTTIEYASSSSQNISTIPPYQNLTFSGGTKTVGSGTLSIAGNWAVGSMTVLNTNNPNVSVTGNITGAGSITNGNGTINIEGNWTNTGSYSGSGTVNYVKPGGGQTIGGNNYNNLSLSNTSGTNTAGGNISVSGTLTQSNASAILDMGTYTLSGNMTPSISGTIQTQNTSSAPLTAGKTWGGTISYNSSSSQTVVNGNYNDLDCTGGNRILSDSGTIGIAGNFIPGAGSYTLTGSTVNFNGSGAQTIPSFTFNNLTISSSGAKSLSGVVSINGTMTFINSIVTSTSTNLLVFNDNATVSGGSNSTHVNGPVKKIGNDPFTYPVGKSGIYAPITISAPSLISDAFTAEYTRGSSLSLGPITAAGLAMVSGCEYWYLDRTTGTSNVNVTLSWSSSSPCNSAGYITDLSSLTVAHFNGTSWDSHGNDGGTTGTVSTGTITWNNVSDFSPFTLGSTSVFTNPLPVKFEYIRAFEKNNGVQVEWSSLTEINVDHYEIERSFDGLQFNTAGQKMATGNNSQRVSYSWLDATPSANVIFYRIKAVDLDGKFTFSKIVRINLNLLSSELLLYPNPVIDKNISFQSGKFSKGIFRLMILDITGRIVYNQMFNHQGGAISQSIQLPYNTASGVYSLRIAGDNFNSTKTFIVK